jgi:hypothetical protein
VDVTAATIAITGLITTAVAALGTPLIQGRVMAKNAIATKLREERLNAYTDTMLYVRAVQGRLDETLQVPDFRQSYTWPDMPHRDLITARLALIAPSHVVRLWDELTAAWETLAWNVQQDGPVNDQWQYQIDANDRDAVRLRQAIKDLTSALRQTAVERGLK